MGYLEERAVLVAAFGLPEPCLNRPHDAQSPEPSAAEE